MNTFYEMTILKFVVSIFSLPLLLLFLSFFELPLEEGQKPVHKSGQVQARAGLKEHLLCLQYGREVHLKYLIQDSVSSACEYGKSYCIFFQCLRFWSLNIKNTVKLLVQNKSLHALDLWIVFPQNVKNRQRTPG